MKKSILLIIILLACVSSGVAQETPSPTLTREYLMSHKWYPDYGIYEKALKRSSVITYTLTQELDSVFKGDVFYKVYTPDYYLSDTKDLVFDTSKVGKTVSGKYLITEQGLDDLAYIFEVVFMSKEKMILRNLTEGFDTTGDLVTLYAQETSSSRAALKLLMKYKWYPDVYSESSKKSSVTTYTSTQIIDSIFEEDINIRVGVCDYYLSDTQETIFDESKVGKTSSGKYIIKRIRSIKPGMDDLILIKEVVSISGRKMELRNLTKGFSSLGYITTYYTVPVSEKGESYGNLDNARKDIMKAMTVPPLKKLSIRQ